MRQSRTRLSSLSGPAEGSGPESANTGHKHADAAYFANPSLGDRSCASRSLTTLREAVRPPGASNGPPGRVRPASALTVHASTACVWIQRVSVIRNWFYWLGTNAVFAPVPARVWPLLKWAWSFSNVNATESRSAG